MFLSAFEVWIKYYRNVLMNSYLITDDEFFLIRLPISIIGDLFS